MFPTGGGAQRHAPGTLIDTRADTRSTNCNIHVTGATRTRARQG